jgi:hypothetical protein
MNNVGKADRGAAEAGQEKDQRRASATRLATAKQMETEGRVTGTKGEAKQRPRRRIWRQRANGRGAWARSKSSKYIDNETGWRSRNKAKRPAIAHKGVIRNPR